MDSSELLENITIFTSSRLINLGFLYINIHTHQASDDNSTLEIRSFYSDFRQAISGITCSIGLHPWYLQDHQQMFKELRRYAALPNVLAIGECGLDKACSSEWGLQINVFRQQIILANELDKPLIIHCVRAFDEFLGLMKKNATRIPVIMHGFNKKANVAEKLLTKGIYLSFGAAIMNDKSPAADVLKHTPASLFFLETDDASIPIKEIYQKTAEIRETSPEAIILQVQQNFNNVFKQQR